MVDFTSVIPVSYFCSLWGLSRWSIGHHIFIIKTSDEMSSYTEVKMISRIPNIESYLLSPNILLQLSTIILFIHSCTIPVNSIQIIIKTAAL